MSLEHPVKEFLLDIQICEVYKFLDNMGTLLVLTNFNDIMFYPLKYLHTLLTGAIDDKLIAKVITIVIDHNIGNKS